jgi:hypothetical protein
MFKGPVVVGLAMALLLAGCGSAHHSALPKTSVPAPTSGAVTTTTSPRSTSRPSTTTSAPSTTTLATTPAASASTPTLGLTGAYFSGAGFGQVEPSAIYLGGDPTGALGSIHWSSWGGAEATGTGIGSYDAPNEPVYASTHEPATVIAFDLGTCADHPAYQAVDWYFPGEGGTFVASQGEDACAQGSPAATGAQAYSPWAETGQLFGDTKVAKTLAGTSCTGPSAFDVDDPYAWRCWVSGGGFYDPCFAPEPATTTDVTEVACADNPWSSVTLIKLSQPLAHGSWGTVPTGEVHSPWALQLANGDECGLIEGTSPEADAMTFNFGCSQGNAAYPSQKTEPWTVKYAPRGSRTVTIVSVASAWS